MNSKVILVEDHSDDAKLAILTLRRSHFANEILHLEDGSELLSYLKDETNTTPRLVFLDIHLPTLDGLQVLKQMKNDERNKEIPVIVLTASTQEKDIIRAHEMGASAYIVKPITFHKLCDAVLQLNLFWWMLDQPPM